jgi:hypothetical protein
MVLIFMRLNQTGVDSRKVSIECKKPGKTMKPKSAQKELQTGTGKVGALISGKAALARGDFQMG